MIEQPDQLQLRIWTGIEPKFDSLVLPAEFGEPEIAMIRVFPLLPSACEVGPVRACVLIACGRPEVGSEFVLGRQRPPDEMMKKIHREIGEVLLDKVRHRPAGQDQRLHVHTPNTNETGAGDVGNSTSSTPTRRTAPRQPAP